MSLAVPLIPLASGCRASLPPWPVAESGQEAFALLHKSAAAHGLSSYLAIHDLNVSYAGHWRWLVGKLQPDLVDAGFRGGSQERLLLRDGLIAQSHFGPNGHKQVVRSNASGAAASTHVWFNGVETQDRDRIDAAALVAEAYSLFLLGPMMLAENQRPHRDIQAALAGTADLVVEKHHRICDVLTLRVTPGLGNSASDELALYIARDTHLMLRVRMTLNGLASTRGALVDVDTFDHRLLHGIMWPTAFHERLLRPAPLDVHEWRLSGLDINRGEILGELTGPTFTGQAAEPATTT